MNSNLLGKLRRKTAMGFVFVGLAVFGIAGAFYWFTRPLVVVELEKVYLRDGDLVAEVRIDGPIRHVHLYNAVETSHPWYWKSSGVVSDDRPLRATLSFRRRPETSESSLPGPVYSVVLLPVTLTDGRRMYIEIALHDKMAAAGQREGVTLTVFESRSPAEDWFTHWDPHPPGGELFWEAPS